MRICQNDYALRHALIALVLLLATGAAVDLHAQALLGTPIRYSRGSMKLNNTLLNGTFDVRFKVWDAATEGNQVGPTLTKTDVAITGGKLPTQTLDFGNDVFTGEARWIEVRARQGGNSFAPVGSRQRLRPVPFALSLPGLYTQQNDTAPNIIGGFAGNIVADGVVGGTISGGGGDTTTPNSITGDFGTVGGGGENSAASYCTVGGGAFNVADGDRATISGGGANVASESGSTVGGGLSNTANEFQTTVAGGGSNTASKGSATVGGGSTNTASGVSSTVGGGVQNAATADRSTVAGGEQNTASGIASTIPGGQLNVASGQFSFAAGRRAKANANGTFVWADANNVDFAVGGANRFSVRATGGAEIFTSLNLSTGVFLSEGSGAWASVSDRNAKANVQHVDTRLLLDKLCAIPITTWNYTSQDESIRHIGPMAQDFHAAFGVGESDKHITTIDADGVALAAIQGLHQLIIEKDAQIESQRQQIIELATRVARLEAASVASSRP